MQRNILFTSFFRINFLNEKAKNSGAMERYDAGLSTFQTVLKTNFQRLVRSRFTYTLSFVRHHADYEFIIININNNNALFL